MSDSPHDICDDLSKLKDIRECSPHAQITIMVILVVAIVECLTTYFIKVYRSILCVIFTSNIIIISCIMIPA